MRYILIILLFLSFHSFGQVGQRTDSMPSDSARIPITEPRRYWIDSQGRYWNSFFLSMDSLRAWGNRQGWGSGGGISFSDTISTIATKYDLDTLTVSGGGVQYSDSITTFTTPTQVHDSVKNKLDSNTVLLKGGWGLRQDVVPLQYTAGDSIIVDSSQVATVYDASLKLDKADTATMLAPYMLYTDTSGMLTNYLIYGDTSSMLSPYLRTANQIDTTSLSNRINLKVSIADTATMLSPYLRKADTLSLSNRINIKLNSTDTASMLSPYLRTANATTGTVTSVATSTGITGGTITTSGTLKADTSLLATQYFVNNTDSVGTITRGVWNGTSISATNYVTDSLPVLRGGTGATTALRARNNLNVNTLIDVYTLLGSVNLSKSLNIGVNNITTSQTMTSGQFVATAVDLMPGGTSVTGVKWWQDAQGVFNAGTNNKIGLYKDSVGTLVLVDSCANDTTLWDGASSTWVSKAFTQPFTTVANTVYYVGYIYMVSGTASTTPTLGASPAMRSSLQKGYDFTNSRKINAAISGQTNLPLTIAQSTMTATFLSIVYFSLY